MQCQVLEQIGLDWSVLSVLLKATVSNMGSDASQELVSRRLEDASSQTFLFLIWPYILVFKRCKADLSEFTK